MYKESDELNLDSDRSQKRHLQEQVLDPSRKAKHSYNMVNGTGNLERKKKKETDL